MTIYYPFERVEEKTNSTIGLKAKLLAKLEENIPIPFSLIITSEVYHSFLQHNNIQKEIQTIVQSKNMTYSNLIANFARVSELFRKASFPQSIVEELRECFELVSIDTTNLNDLSSKNEPLSIISLRRSVDYIDEDHICKGTIYTKNNFQEFLKSIKSCFLGLFTPSAVIDRAKKDVFDFNIGIIVSRLPKMTACLEVYYPKEKQNMFIASYNGFLDPGQLVSRDVFTIGIEFLKINHSKIKQQKKVSVFNINTNRPEIQTFNRTGSAQSLPDQIVLEAGRLTKKIAARIEQKEFVVDFINQNNDIYCLDIRGENQTINPSSTKKEIITRVKQEVKEEVKTESRDGTVDTRAVQVFAKPLREFLYAHRFSKFGPSIEVIIRMIDENISPESIKQGLLLAKQIIEEWNK